MIRIQGRAKRNVCDDGQGRLVSEIRLRLGSCGRYAYGTNTTADHVAPNLDRRAREWMRCEVDVSSESSDRLRRKVRQHFWWCLDDWPRIARRVCGAVDEAGIYERGRGRPRSHAATSGSLKVLGDPVGQELVASSSSTPRRSRAASTSSLARASATSSIKSSSSSLVRSVMVSLLPGVVRC